MNFEEPVFQEANSLGWVVCRDHAKWGVFVVPPYGESVEDWTSGVPKPISFLRKDAEATRPIVLSNLLNDEEIALVRQIGDDLLEAGLQAGSASASLFDASDESTFHETAEEMLHDLAEHRVIYLHRIEANEAKANGLHTIETKLIDAIRCHDHLGMLSARQFHLRSLEYHVYGDGGSVLDPQHRDDGSLLTLSLLLSEPEVDFQGGIFSTWNQDKLVEHPMQKGDGVLFASEKRHNVS